MSSTDARTVSSALTGAVATIRQFGRYGFAGGMAALTHLVVLSLLVELVGFDKAIASAIGFLAAIPVNYLLQHRFVFARAGRHGHYFARYLGVTLAGLGLNCGLFLLGVNVLGFHYLPTQIAVIGLVFVANFFVNRHFTFSQSGPIIHELKEQSLGRRGGNH